EVNVDGRTRVGPGLSVTTVNLPQAKGKKTLIDPKGEWTIELFTSDRTSPSLDYHLMVVLDNPTIVTEYRIDSLDAGTGESVPVRVKVTDAGAPVQNAAVVAEPVGPLNGVGNILSTQPTPTGTPNTSGDAVRSEA